MIYSGLVPLRHLHLLPSFSKFVIPLRTSLSVGEVNHLVHEEFTFGDTKLNLVESKSFTTVL